MSTSCIDGGDTHIFLSPGGCSPWSEVLSKQCPLRLLSFLPFLFFLTIFRAMYFQRVTGQVILRDSARFFFHNLFSSGFDRMHCESSLLCLSVKMDCLQLLLKVFEQTWSDFALQKAFRVLRQLVFRPSIGVAMF